MLTLELPTEIEQHFQEIVQTKYHGDIQMAVSSLLKLYDKYGWKEQLREDVDAIRSEVSQQGGISSETIDDAIKTYRKQRFFDNPCYLCYLF